MTTLSRRVNQVVGHVSMSWPLVPFLDAASSPPGCRCGGVDRDHHDARVNYVGGSTAAPEALQLLPSAGSYCPDADDVAVVHHAVHCRHGHRSTREDLVPFPERLVGGHQQEFALVPVADQLKEHPGLQLVAPHEGDVVDNQQAVAIQLLDHSWQLIAGLGLLQQLHQSRGGEEAAGLGLLDHRHHHVVVRKPG